MYVWQMNDGRWHISLAVSVGVQGALHAAILNNANAFRLYDRGYENERDARDAERAIRTLINADEVIRRAVEALESGDWTSWGASSRATSSGPTPVRTASSPTTAAPCR